MKSNYTYKVFKDGRLVKFINENELEDIRSSFKNGFIIRAETDNMPLLGMTYIKSEDDLDAWYAQIERKHWVKKEQSNIEFYYDGNLIAKFGIDEYLNKDIRDTTEYNLENDHLIAEFIVNDKLIHTFYNEEQFDRFLMDYIQKDTKENTAVDPAHYKGYVEELQWLDTMSRIPTLRDPIKFEAAVELQIRKYLDRNGQKDESLQELQKALWYLKYLIAYKKAGRPIKVGEVDSIL
jgi:hypothetical protein